MLVSVAPTAPYPGLLETGPRATWMRDIVPGVSVFTYSGLPLSRSRRQLSDLREMLRYTGAQLGHLGTVDASATLLRCYGRLAATAASNKRTVPNRVVAEAARKTIVAASSLASRSEAYLLSPIKDRRVSRVTETDGHLLVRRANTLSNSLSIQMAVLGYLASAPPRVGALFVTSSAYVDLQRYQSWAGQKGRGVLVAGSNALAESAGDSAALLSGFCQYYSTEAIHLIAGSTGFDHSKLNDEAMTIWLTSRGIGWTDPGIVWNTDELIDGRCPLCSDPTKFVVRCTSHGSRDREAEHMRSLHHPHRALGAEPPS